MLNITLKGGEVRQFETGTSIADIAKSLGAGLFKAACAGKIDGRLVDLRDTVTADCTVEILTFNDPEGKKAFWHTSSHLLAQAVMRLYPNTKYTIGPAVDNGFYYDFDVEKPFAAEDLQKIEDEMRKLVKAGLELTRFIANPDEARAIMKDQPYKLELIDKHAAEGGDVSFYRQGDFTDLCAGPHLLALAPIKAVKLIQCTGAYWHGDSNLPMLCRVYGISFPKASELTEYLEMIEEAKRRDHRKLGRELDLFDLYEEGPGFPFFFPKGMTLRNTLENFWRMEHRKAGYQEIRTPLILNEELWHRSGHWDHYKDNMYTTKIDDKDYAIKPMNCPGGMMAYKRRLHSYRDLPQRLAEMGVVHRHELSGALHGLMRVRCFTQDDAHIFMTPDQIEEEILGVIRLIDRIYAVFGFSYKMELSTRPEDSMGSEEQWEIATSALRSALVKNGKEYTVNEGDGAFYGPKIDFHLQDSIGRTWQCGTIQLDFQMPERFELAYVGSDSEKHRPVMVHRTAFGSIERFIGILTEHYAGAFPLWLAPVQVKLLPVTEEHVSYAEQVLAKLEQVGLRVELDIRNEKVGYRVREAQLEKIPYMLVIGDKEAEQGGVAVRCRKNGDKGILTVDRFLELALSEIESHSNDPLVI